MSSRRITLVLLTAILALVILVSVTLVAAITVLDDSSSTGASDTYENNQQWPSFQHDAQNSGSVSGVDFVSGTFQTHWTFAVSEYGPHANEEGSFRLSRIAVSEETIYVGTQWHPETSESFQERTGGFYAIDSSTGELKWRISLEDDKVIATDTAPVIWRDSVIIQGNSNIYSISRSTGEIEWQFPHRWSSFGSPTVANGVIYSGTGNGTLRAINAKSGKVEWQTTPGEEYESATIWSTPVVSQGMVYVTTEVVTEDGETMGLVTALDTSNGAIEWETRIGPVDHTSPTVSDSRLLVSSIESGICDSCQGIMTALNRYTGSIEWEVKADERVIGPTAVAEGRAFYSTRDGLYAIDISSGVIDWKTGSIGYGGSPTVVNDYVFTEGPGIYQYSINGKLVYKYPFDWGSKVVYANGRLYTVSDNPTQIMAFSPHSRFEDFLYIFGVILALLIPAIAVVYYVVYRRR